MVKKSIEAFKKSMKTYYEVCVEYGEDDVFEDFEDFFNQYMNEVKKTKYYYIDEYGREFVYDCI